MIGDGGDGGDGDDHCVPAGEGRGCQRQGPAAGLGQ